MLNSINEGMELIEILLDYKEVILKLTFETNVIIIKCEPKYVSVIHEDLVAHDYDRTHYIVTNYGNMILQPREV